MNLLKKNKKAFLTVILVLSLSCLFAQQTFRYQAALPKVDADGFYRIDLKPELIAKSAVNLNDIRILNQKKQFSPYIFGNQLVFKDLQSFIAFPKLKIDAAEDTVTTFIAENTARLIINQLSLQLRNTSVKRVVNLSGSDDLNKWYAVKENILLEAAGSGNTNNETYQQQLNFPSSSYRYFKIKINNENKEPVAILQAGIYKQQFTPAVYVKLQDAVIKQKDSAQVSRIVIRLNDNYQVNKLHPIIAGQKFYKRNIRVYAITCQGKTLITDTVISSSAKPELYFSSKTRYLELEILNGDNPPLVFDGVIAYQLNQSLISYLEKGQDYVLLFGDKDAITPDYDLKFFGDSLRRDLKQLDHGAISQNPLYKQTVTKKRVKEELIPGWLIWVAIAIVAALLGFLTFRMTQEVGKREDKENPR
ncbi:hypothetical protein TH53_06490 [Pedobacter lusitanus]|uniref:Contig26, whole genome shotgun sequence n=1 Tax=Pedobacter lusitanus TaxID=1503925 RepID=A0A0D0F8E4_9SPHI|nr:hypothetical protein [Pedobacter lusitanus]KIO77938.1 hypothetical protein TH53_06490 [Pedobacter lusitanus]